MAFKELDTVVVVADLAQLGLKRGDVGAVVQVYSPGTIEVEFVMASGHTQAVVTLGTHQVRPVGPKDLLAVRQLDAA
jgi:allophanate hydrolase subunit 2